VERAREQYRFDWEAKELRVAAREPFIEADYLDFNSDAIAKIGRSSRFALRFDPAIIPSLRDVCRVTDGPNTLY